MRYVSYVDRSYQRLCCLLLPNEPFPFLHHEPSQVPPTHSSLLPHVHTCTGISHSFHSVFATHTRVHMHTCTHARVGEPCAFHVPHTSIRLSLWCWCVCVYFVCCRAPVKPPRDATSCTRRRERCIGRRLTSSRPPASGPYHRSASITTEGTYLRFELLLPRYVPVLTSLVWASLFFR